MLEHRVDFKLTKEDFDDRGQIKLKSLLFYCQEAATQHADIIGIGMDALLEKNIIWVLVKTKLRILGDLIQDMDYYLMTYPRAQKSRYCPRDYYIYNENHELVVVGSSIWSLVDYTTRKMVRMELDFGGEMRQDEAFEEGFEKIRVKETVDAGTYTVIDQDIDANEHTNNCTYGEMVQQVKEDAQVKEFLIQFSKETKLGDTVELHKQYEDGCLLVSGTLQGGETVFQSKITIG